jgi:hypothetical protein
VEVRADCSRREIVIESKIRIYKEIELYVQHAEVCTVS